MQHFDPAAWRARSWSRLRRAAGKGRPSHRAEAAWAADQYAIADLESVVEWCRGRGVEVVFGKRAAGVYDEATRRVTISAHAPARKQLVYLLHECGHHLVSSSNGDDDRFKMGYSAAMAEGVERTFVHKLAVLEEEFEAWHRGWRLARRLELSLGREDFDRVRLECLKSYVQWSNRRSKD